MMPAISAGRRFIASMAAGVQASFLPSAARQTSCTGLLGHCVSPQVSPSSPVRSREASSSILAEAEKLPPPKPAYVRIKAPPGIGAVQTFSGRRITIGEDRILEMSEEDANCLIPAGWTLLT